MKKKIIVILLASAVILAGCSSTKEVAKSIETFDFTPAEMTDELKTNRLIDFTAFDVVDTEEKAEKIATFGSITDIFNDDNGDTDAMIHYSFTYDSTTYNTSCISFFMDRNSTAAAERYLYHIYSIASCIDPSANTEEISSAIENGFNDNGFAIYKGKNFVLNASRSEKYFSANFTPIEN